MPVFDNELLAMYVLSERELSPSLHTFWKYVVATSTQSTPRPKNTLPKSRVSKTYHKQFPIPDTTILNIYLPHFYFEPSQKVAYLIEKEYLD